MQCTSYLSGYYYSRDQIVDGSGSLSQQFNNGIFCRSDRGYNILFLPPSIDQYLAYNKEILSQTMLKHEAVFKYQVHELHRLYGRQRELMNEIKMMELSKDHLPLQTPPSNSFVSGMQWGTSRKTLQLPCWPFLNPRDDMPSGQGVENIQTPSSFVSRKSIQAGSDVYLAGNHFKELEASSCTRNKYGKKMLDLELPPEEYMDSDEREQLELEKSAEVSPVLHDPSLGILGSWSRSNLILNKGASSNISSSCRKASCSFDLNETLQFDEPVTTFSTSLVDSNTSSTEIMHQNQDICGKPRSETPNLNEIAHDILEGKGSLESSSISGFQVPSAGNLLFSRNNETSLGLKSAKTDQDILDTNRQRMLSPINTSSQLVHLSGLTNTRGSTSVSSQRAACNEVPIAIQALPCFNSPQFSTRTTRSSTGNSGVKGNYVCSNRNPAYSPSLGNIASHTSCNCDNQLSAEYYSVARCVKDSDHKNFVGDVDLNVMPSCSLPETEYSQDKHRSMDRENRFENSLGPLNGPKVRPDSEGVMIESPQILEHPISRSQYEDLEIGEKVDFPAICMAYNSSEKLKKSPKYDTCLAHESGKEIPPSKHLIDLTFSVREKKQSQLPTVTTAVGPDIQAPISPDNKEHSPPREESEDNRSEKVGDSMEDLERIAAEAIVSIMLSGKQKNLNTCTSQPLDASVECLNWFAGIVYCSVVGAGENELEDHLTDAPGGNCKNLSSTVLEHSEAMAFMSRGSKIEDHCYMQIDQKNKLIGDMLLPSRGQATKPREWKKFQSQVLPCASSLSSDDAIQNLWPIRELKLAGRTAPETVKVRKKFGRVSRAKGRKPSKKFPLNIVSRRTCSLSKQNACQSEQSFLQSCTFGWGKKNRRQKHRRARTSVDFGFS